MLGAALAHPEFFGTELPVLLALLLLLVMMMMLLASTASSLRGHITHVSTTRPPTDDDNGDDFTTLCYQFTVATGALAASDSATATKPWVIRTANNRQSDKYM